MSGADGGAGDSGGDDSDSGDGDSSETGTPPTDDHDGDGYAPEEGDCDDADPARGPGVVEEPGDGQDQDCDGLDIETQSMGGPTRVGHGWDQRMGEPIAMGDLDGDGLDDLAVAFPGSGDSTESTTAPFEPSYVETHLSPVTDLMGGTVHGALEEDYVSIVGHGLSVGDTDDDGLADLAYSVPLGDGTDHTTGLVYVVGGPADQTTDPEVDAPPTIIGETRGRFLGYTMDDGVVDFDGDGFGDLVVGGETPDGKPDVGRAYVFTGPFHQDRMESDAFLTLLGEVPGDRTGAALDHGDFDGDGHPDIVVGGYDASPTGVQSGKAWIAYGPGSGVVELSLAEAAVVGENAGDYAGHAVACIGDVDGDGADELAVGALYSDAEGELSGRNYVLDGPVSGVVGLGDADAIIRGGWAYDWSGRSILGVGDVTHDGFGDLLLGSPQTPGKSPYFGRVSLFAGPFAGTLLPEDASAVWVSPTFGDLTGSGLAVSDFDGDTKLDLVVGAPFDSSETDRNGSVTVIPDAFE